MIKSICVFCGSSVGARPEYAAAAQALAGVLTEHGITVVYGAGRVGLMGVLADAALALGGRVVGVIPEYLCRKEVMHDGLSELHVTQSLLERKLLMMEMVDAFIALPGGLGTFDEILEVYSWAQLGRHDKPFGLINTCDYFQPFLAMLDHAVAEGFLAREQLRRLHTATAPRPLLEQLLERGA